MKHRKGNWDPAASNVENARRELPEFAAEYFSDGRRAVKKGTSADRLHEFRLATKHFRYLLELFRPVYGPRLDQYLEQLRRIQTLLGELNDYESTREMMSKGPDAAHPDTRKLLRYIDRQQSRRLAAFRDYWKTVFDAGGEEQNWRGYLGRQAGRKAPGSSRPLARAKAGGA